MRCFLYLEINCFLFFITVISCGKPLHRVEPVVVISCGKPLHRVKHVVVMSCGKPLHRVEPVVVIRFDLYFVVQSGSY